VKIFRRVGKVDYPPSAALAQFGLRQRSVPWTLSSEDLFRLGSQTVPVRSGHSRDVTSSEAPQARWVINEVDPSIGGAATGSRRVRDLLPDDLRSMVERSPGGRIRWLAEVATKIVLYPRVRAVIFYRFGQVLVRRRFLPLAYALQARAIRGSGAEISPFADIGPGLCLVHSVGIVVGPSVTAGSNLRLYHGVTLGDGSLPGQPILGADVMVGAGAAVLGGVRIGDRSIIGAHAVVTTDVPADSIATGAPASYRPRLDRHSIYSRNAD